MMMSASQLIFQVQKVKNSFLRNSTSIVLLAAFLKLIQPQLSSDDNVAADAPLWEFWGPSYGAPCLRMDKSFEGVGHTFVLGTRGTKFYGDGYNYWVPHVIAKGSVEHFAPSFDENQFKFNTTAGTYSHYKDELFGTGETTYYVPEMPVETVDGWEDQAQSIGVSGDILEKLDSHHYDSTGTESKSNKVVSKLGFPVDTETEASSGFGSRGLYQTFIGGEIFNSLSERVIYYVTNPMKNHHNDNGGSAGTFGFPTSDPIKIDDSSESQDFEGTRITSDASSTSNTPVWHKKDPNGDFNVLIINLDTEIDTPACFKHYIGLDDGIEIGDPYDKSEDFNAERFSKILSSSVPSAIENRRLNGAEPIASINGDLIRADTSAPMSINFSLGHNYIGDGHASGLWSSMAISDTNEVLITRNIDDVEVTSDFEYNIIGGGPQIVNESNFTDPCSPHDTLGRGCFNIKTGFSQPRTIAGVTTGNHMIAIVADSSPGLTTAELADALNTYSDVYGEIVLANMFDGGGSPSMMFENEILTEGNNELSSLLMVYTGDACSF